MTATEFRRIYHNITPRHEQYLYIIGLFNGDDVTINASEIVAALTSDSLTKLNSDIILKLMGGLGGFKTVTLITVFTNIVNDLIKCGFLNSTLDLRNTDRAYEINKPLVVEYFKEYCKYYNPEYATTIKFPHSHYVAIAAILEPLLKGDKDND